MPQYASFRFTPTWFGSQYVVGETDLTLSYIFPKDTPLDAIRWQKDKDRWDHKGIRDDRDGRPSVVWRRKVRLTQAHMFGVSFPKGSIANVTHMTIFKMIGIWWRGNPGVQIVSAVLQNGPEHIAKLREEMSAWLEKKEYESLAQAQGSMNLAKSPQPLIYERGNYVKLLQGYARSMGAR